MVHIKKKNDATFGMFSEMCPQCCCGTNQKASSKEH